MQSNLYPFEQHLQALGPTAVAVIVGLVASLIAWRQWRTANYRLRFDLFERRVAVYESVRDLISIAQVHGQIAAKDIDKFYSGIRGAEFLFDGELRHFIMKLGDMSFRARMARVSSERQLQTAKADKLMDKEEKILEFLQGQAPNLERMFGRYNHQACQ